MNKLTISGVISPATYSHSINNLPIYKYTISSTRTSGTVDQLPVYSATQIIPGFVQLMGEFRSHNTPERKLQLYIHPIEISYPSEHINKNEIQLQGFICKQPNYRTTPAGKEITDILLAVPRSNVTDRSDYLPCIAWGDNFSDLEIGTEISISGRVQSREYVRAATGEKCVAYEVSIS